MSHNIDHEIARTLRDDDAALLSEFGGDLSMLGMVTETFRTKNAWLIGIVWFWAFIFFVLAVFCGIQVYRTTELRPLLLWLTGGVLAIHAVGMLKMWYFMEMHRVTIAREIKRLELQTARLAKRLDSQHEVA